MNGAFRQVNELIRSQATSSAATETWEFFCECSDVACHAFVSMTLLEFDERVALSPPLPILATRHGQAGSEGDAVRTR